MLKLCNVTKKYGDVTAVKNFSLTVEDGEFFGLLGPNGAGKTTTVDMISTVLLPTDGAIYLDDEKLDRRSGSKKGKISVVTQEYSMRLDMNADEVMEYQGRLYMLPLSQIRERTEELLDLAGLTEHRKKKVRQLSGGLKRRLLITRALLTRPKLLLLDEPTAGMDAISRRHMWELLGKLNREGLTIVLTTHYLEEAEYLCGRVALMDKGSIIKTGKPQDLITDLGRYSVDVTEDDRKKSRFFKDRDEAIAFLSKTDAGENAALRNTTLEDVFVELVGKEWE